MADYVLPQKLRDSFAALYVTTDCLPYVLDIKCKVYEICRQGKRSAYLHQALTQLCLTILNEQEKLCKLSQLTYRSPVYRETGERTHNDCLQFFQLVCEEFLKNEEAKCDDICEHLKEVATYVTLFNGVIAMRINCVHRLFDALFEYLCSYSPHEEFGARVCECETFRRSGDCNCPIEDIAKDDDDNMSL